MLSTLDEQMVLLSVMCALQPASPLPAAHLCHCCCCLLLLCSEKKLRRLEIATNSPKLARLQLYRLLSHSESRWASELSSAGLTPEGAPKPGVTHG